MEGAKQLLGEAASFQRQQGTRSYAHRFTTLYLYKEGGAMPSVMHHSLSGHSHPLGGFARFRWYTGLIS